MAIGPSHATAPDQRRDKASSRERRGALIAPELARVEVASALIRKGLGQQLAGADLEPTQSSWFRGLADGRVILLPDSDDIEAAAKLAMKLQHPLPHPSTSLPPSVLAQP